MIENVRRICEEANRKVETLTNVDSLEQFRVHYLGKKGELTQILHQLRNLDPDSRKTIGAVVNEYKTALENQLETRKKEIERKSMESELLKTEPIDVTLPGHQMIPLGAFHPVSKTTDQIISILKRIGFSVVMGPEVETEYYNFEALNTPPDHPARDLQDTFYLNTSTLLRSHTSPVQIRAMKAKHPPLQIIAIGKVYRSDFDVTHTPMFHQIEGLMVDEKVSFSDLKGVLSYLVKNLFGTKHVRFRPSYFPFTEPSAEVDMQCIQCKGNGSDCRICKSTGWLEIGGCGMVHPNVFRAVQYDTDRYRGFAFGMGIERIAMLKYGIEDLRSFFENDFRMLEQF